MKLCTQTDATDTGASRQPRTRHSAETVTRHADPRAGSVAAGLGDRRRRELLLELRDARPEPRNLGCLVHRLHPHR